MNNFLNGWFKLMNMLFVQKAVNIVNNIRGTG